MGSAGPRCSQCCHHLCALSFKTALENCIAVEIRMKRRARKRRGRSEGESAMIALDISAAERHSGVLSPEHLDAAVRAMLEDGFVVLNDVIDLTHLALLRERMLEDLPQI